MFVKRYQHQAKILIESLPYLRCFRGKIIVIKYGGHAMTDEVLKHSFAMNVALLKYVGICPVIVHGGGPQIGDMLKKLNIESAFHDGLRITDDATMDVVEMVLIGKVNKDIVSQINSTGEKAVGLSGKDGNIIKCRKFVPRSKTSDPAEKVVDLGRVGDVTEVDTSLITHLCNEGFIPVIAPVGVGEDNLSYNINADNVAAAVAGALKAKRLLLLTDVMGILDKNKELIHSINKEKAQELLEDGTLQGGMIPKVHCALETIDAGVEKVMIIDGRVENCILLELFTNTGVGTEIIKE